MKIDASIECTPIQRITAKFPDVLPMDYCAFSLLKNLFLSANPLRFMDFGKLSKRNENKYFW